MPVTDLSEVLKEKARMAVENNWTVDEPVKVLSQQGLEAGYRAFLGSLAVPPQMEAEEFPTRMHRLGVTLLYVIRQQEAFGFDVRSQIQPSGGLGAPDGEQRPGSESAKAFRELVEGRSLRVLIYIANQYELSVADIYCENMFVQECMLLRDGHAGQFLKYDHRPESRRHPLLAFTSRFGKRRCREKVARWSAISRFQALIGALRFSKSVSYRRPIASHRQTLETTFEFTLHWMAEARQPQRGPLGGP
ncbi:hypothetical protein KFL_000210200 [Klebsormidium nitens]|uniref:Uncharacterized protein n=1 Tax=Klebsormidium nitens TaxID=105231 RepID=A0A1Y1HK43_KLENI|nr:hypothetical protein KFL_000210200 [Klebsormidium nitens]|eukprot:GAQ78934.1 hypothetical protein KFL_000210200 [Klebsormidium nitens]